MSTSMDVCERQTRWEGSSWQWAEMQLQGTAPMLLHEPVMVMDCPDIETQTLAVYVSKQVSRVNMGKNLGE